MTSDEMDLPRVLFFLLQRTENLKVLQLGEFKVQYVRTLVLIRNCWFEQLSWLPI